jgi:hypothetical protein
MKYRDQLSLSHLPTIALCQPSAAQIGSSDSDTHEATDTSRLDELFAPMRDGSFGMDSASSRRKLKVLLGAAVGMSRSFYVLSKIGRCANMKALLLFLCSCIATGAYAQELFLHDVLFASSKDWFLIDGLQVPNPRGMQGGKLMFRKYYVYIIANKIDDVPSLANSMLFTCQKGHRDYLTFHIPDRVVPKMRRDQWISEMNMRILADGTSTEFIGEYIKGDIFVDITSTTFDDLLHVIESKEISVEFGPGNDRLNFYQDDFTPGGTGDLRGFLREYLPESLKNVGGRNFRTFDQRSMFEACRKYKSRI